MRCNSPFYKSCKETHEPFERMCWDTFQKLFLGADLRIFSLVEAWWFLMSFEAISFILSALKCWFSSRLKFEPLLTHGFWDFDVHPYTVVFRPVNVEMSCGIQHLSFRAGEQSSIPFCWDSSLQHLKTTRVAVSIFGNIPNSSDQSQSQAQQTNYVALRSECCSSLSNPARWLKTRVENCQCACEKRATRRESQRIISLVGISDVLRFRSQLHD